VALLFRVALLLASVSLSSSAAAAPAFTRPRYTTFPDTLTMTALVTIGGVRQEAGALIAVIGEEVRGMQEGPLTPPFGPYNGVALYQMTVYADGDGEKMSFWFESSAGTAALKETLEFEVNRNVGNALEPLLLSAASFDKSLSLGFLSQKVEL